MSDETMAPERRAARAPTAKVAAAAAVGEAVADRRQARTGEAVRARRQARNSKGLEAVARALRMGKPPPRPEPTEDQVQRAVVGTFHARRRPGVELFHVPNGGALSSVIEGRRLKRQGVVAGIPDLVICADGRFYAIELKAKGGRLSDAQRAMIDRLAAAGATVAVCFGVDAAVAQLEQWGVLK